MQRLLGTLALLAVVGSISACDKFLAPDQFSGTFALVRIGESSLPAATPSALDQFAGVTTSVAADTLVFRSDGSGTWRTVWQQRTLTGDTVEVVPFELPFKFSIRGEMIIASFLDCESRCDVVFQELAVRTASDGLRRARHPGAWQYERVSATAR